MTGMAQRELLQYRRPFRTAVRVPHQHFGETVAAAFVREIGHRAEQAEMWQHPDKRLNRATDTEVQLTLFGIGAAKPAIMIHVKAHGALGDLEAPRLGVMG